MVYCPLYRDDFWGCILSLFGSVFSGESWFMDYLDRLEALGNSYSVSSFLTVVRLFGSEVRSVSNSIGGGSVSEGAIKSVVSIEGSYGGLGSGGGSGSSVGVFGGLLSSRSFDLGGSSNVASSGFDWWSLVLCFVGGGAGNVGCLVLLFLFVGFVLGLFI